MVRTQVSFDETMYRLAKDEARKQGISFAELCRRAIAGALQHRMSPQPWMRFAGSVQSNDPCASQTIDEVVYGRERP